MKIKISCLLFLLAQTVLTTEQALKRNQDLATLKSLYSSQVDDEIIGSYFEMYSYNIHETSDALREMIDENNAITSEENDANVIEERAQDDKMCTGIQKRKMPPLKLFSKELQINISSRLSHPRDVLKAGLVDKNWTGVANVFKRITPNAVLFENIETNQLIFETEKKSWNQIEIAEKLEKWGIPFSQKLLEEKNWNKLFYELIWTKDRGVQEFLRALAEIVDVSAKIGKLQSTAVHTAIESRCDTEIIEILLKRPETNPNLKDVFGHTALHRVVCERNSDDIIKMLLEHGADVDATDNKLKSPLMAAAENGKCFVVSLLLAHDANPNLRDAYKKTALHYAAEEADRATTIEILLNSGAEVDERDEHLKNQLKKMGLSNKRKRKSK